MIKLRALIALLTSGDYKTSLTTAVYMSFLLGSASHNQLELVEDIAAEFRRENSSYRP